MITVTILEAVQLVTTLKFFYDTKRIKEIGWLPKLIIIIGNIPGITRFLNITLKLMRNEGDKKTYLPVVTPFIFMGVFITNVAFWIKFLRV